MVMVDDFLSHEECNHIISRCRDKWEDAQVSDAETYGKVTDRRNAKACWLELDDTLFVIQRKIALLSNLEIDHQEKFHVVRYDVGGKFVAHFDWAEPGDFPTDAQENATRRLMTFLMYLDDAQGGETFFPSIDVKIKPKRGRLVIWSNFTSEGKGDPRTMHAALPVIRGQKHIATVWVHDGRIS